MNSNTPLLILDNVRQETSMLT